MQEDKQREFQNRCWFPHSFNLELLLRHALFEAKQAINCNRAFISDYKLGSDSVILFISFISCQGFHKDLISKSPLEYLDGETNLVVESEASTIRFIERNTRIPVPHVYRYASTIDNELHWPYKLMSKAKGEQRDNLC